MLMSTLLTTLAKLAARWPPLISRVTVCIAKMERHQHAFHPAVMARATELLTILQSPSIASALLDSKLRTTFSATALDKDSPLPFLLRTPEEQIGRAHV